MDKMWVRKTSPSVPLHGVERDDVKIDWEIDTSIIAIGFKLLQIPKEFNFT